jgi:hypothetical protein
MEVSGTILRFSGSLLLTVLGAGCLGGSRQAVQTEDRFGHRAESGTEESRTTIVISPASSEQEYRFFPATVQTVNVRIAPITKENATVGVPVELLIKGAFPDSCTELHDVTQEQAGNLISVNLQMRRPKGRVCATVLRPYRFYLSLDGAFPPGPYVVRLNGKSYPFEVHPLTS